MKSFLKIVLASLVGLILFSILAFFFTMFMMIGAVSSMNSGSSSVVDSNSVLKIDINSAIDEYEAGDALDFASAMNFGKSNLGLNSIIKAIKNAKTDDKIKGIVLNFGIENSIGFSQVEEIRNALKDFKADTCNKFIYTYSNIYSQNAYWLSSLADSIFMQNVGSIDLRGLGTQLAFFKGTLDKLGVEMQVVRHGKFKSAVEPYVQNKMSSENKEQYSVLLNSMWGKISSDICKDRNIASSRLDSIIENMYGMFPELSLREKLVDVLASEPELKKAICNRLSIENEKDLKFVDLKKYSSSIKTSTTSKDKIAVVYANGEIGTAKGNSKEIGISNISSAIRTAADDSNTKAIVLRVNSPGGAVLTSDIIYRDVLYAKEKKPVIASYSAYAASGGYYISCACNRVFALNTTVTGSIGVFGLIPNLEKTANKIGIDFDGLSTHSTSMFPSTLKSMSAKERDIMQQNIEETYLSFISKVANGRGMSLEKVDSLGQGRVWSGISGLEIGLVDEIGGLDEAVAYAAKLAELKDYKLENLPKAKSKYSAIIESLSEARAEARANEIKSLVGKDIYNLMQIAEELKKNKKASILARMPYIEVY